MQWCSFCRLLSLCRHGNYVRGSSESDGRLRCPRERLIFSVQGTHADAAIGPELSIMTKSCWIQRSRHAVPAVFILLLSCFPLFQCNFALARCSAYHITANFLVYQGNFLPR
jgi:hypothetical protein